jgi:hypothetical protein
VAADAPAPQAQYRVLRGIFHHPGGVARPGDVIPLAPVDGDPLCTPPNAVLERLEDPFELPPGTFDVIGEGGDWQTGERPDDAPPGEQIDGQGLEPIAPEPAPAPKRRRKATP